MANGISSGDNAWRRIAVDAMSDADRAKSANIGSDMNSMINRAIENADKIQRDIDDSIEDAKEAAKPTALDYVNTTLEGLAGIAKAFGSAVGTAGFSGKDGAVSTSGQSQVQMSLDSAINNYNEKNPATVTALQSAVDAATARQAEINKDLPNLEKRRETFKDTDDKAQFFKNETTEALKNNADIVDEQNKIIKQNESFESQLLDKNLVLTSQKADVQQGTDAAEASKAEATEQKNSQEIQIKNLEGQNVKVTETKEGAIQAYQGAQADVSKYSGEVNDLNSQKGTLEGELNTIKNDTTTYTKTVTETDANGNTTTKTVPDEAKRKAAITAKQAEIDAVADKITAAEKNKKTAEARANEAAQQIQVGNQTLAQLAEQTAQAEQTRDNAIAGIQQAVNNITALKQQDTEISANLQNISTNLKNVGTENANAESAAAIVTAANKDINEMQLDTQKVAETAKQTKKELDTNIKALTTEKNALDKSLKKANKKLTSASKADGKAEDTKDKGDVAASTTAPTTSTSSTDMMNKYLQDKRFEGMGYKANADGTYSKDGKTYIVVGNRLQESMFTLKKPEFPKLSFGGGDYKSKVEATTNEE